MLFGGSHDGYVYALNAITGELLWRYESGEKHSSPTVINGILYSGSIDGYLYALNARSGKLIWKYKTRGIILDSEIHSPPVFVDGLVYVACSDGAIYSLDALTGKKIRSYQSGKLNLNSSPVVINGFLYATNENGSVTAWNLSNTQMIWQKIPGN